MNAKQNMENEIDTLRTEMREQGLTPQDRARKAHHAFRQAYVMLRACKPEDRSAADRTYQIAVAAIEAAWGAFSSWIGEDGPRIP